MVMADAATAIPLWAEHKNAGIPSGYKVAEAGIVPLDWDVKPLGTFIALQRGHDLTERDRRKGDIPVMGSAGPNGFHDTALVRGPGVVIGRSGASFGKAHYCKTDFWPHNTALYVTDFYGNFPLFVFYLLRSIDFSGHNSGGAQQSLNRNFIAPIIIAAPKVEEQQIIANALSEADALIDSLEQLITKKRLIKQGTMQELLSGNTRLLGFAAKWDEKTFGQIFDFYPTATNSRSDLNHDGNTYYIHYGDIHTRFHSHLDFGAEQPARIDREKCRNAAFLKNGDWIMVDASEDFDGVGKSIEVMRLGQEDQAVAGLHTFLLREKTPTFVSGFKGHLGNLKSLHDQYLRVMTGMKVFGVSKTALKDLTLSIPEADEQTRIVEVLTDMNAEIEALEGKLVKVRQIKLGMMQELLTGRVRLV